MALGKVTVQTGAIGPGSFPEVEGIALFMGTVDSGEGAANAIGVNSDLAALFGSGELVDTIKAARENGGPRWKAWAIGYKDVQQNIDNAGAVDKGGGLVGIPVTGHGIPIGASVTLAGTVSYDGSYTVEPETTADEVVITATFVAEPFDGTETITWNQNWEDVIGAGLAAVNPEMLVVSTPVTTAAELTTMQTRAVTELNLAKRLFFIATFRGIAAETWAAYLTAAQAITTGLAAQRVMISPLLYGAELGAFAGRLAKFALQDRKVSRSPMRVRSGAVVNPGSKPSDAGSIVLDLATLEALDADRFSVFQWYEGKEGVYFADANTLEAAAGDFPVVEWLRVTDKGARQVRLVAINAIADDAVQNTPAGNSAFATRLSAPLRAMANAGEIKPLAKDAITVQWNSVTAVEVFITVRPVNAPKDITVSILLDTQTP